MKRKKQDNLPMKDAETKAPTTASLRCGALVRRFFNETYIGDIFSYAILFVMLAMLSATLVRYFILHA